MFTKKRKQKICKPDLSSSNCINKFTKHTKRRKKDYLNIEQIRTCMPACMHTYTYVQLQTNLIQNSY